MIGGDIAVRLRRSARARRMVLRVPRDGGDPVLTLPPRVTEAEGRAFAESRAGWLRQARAALPVTQRVAPGSALPVEGRVLTVTPHPLRAARIEGDRLLIPVSRPAGPVAAAFLKHLAHDRLRHACARHAAALGRDFRALSLRDTRSRWGSCTADGRLMFSWRLAMAPPEVLDYVAAHEVAHLAHMDHSPRFWSAVAALMPGYAPHRDWLRRHGGDLLLWQFRD
ncbi:MAG: SprT family zinc-dependent metalloprotease [Paracoccus sp. (in: a-proteobacteria)]|nr:SprT family zinc-dependent metalloprotease [Paracoccus sp. (in: a-proteobacteria)]